MFNQVPRQLKKLFHRVHRIGRVVGARRPTAKGAAALASITAIAFSLAFFAGGLALVLGLTPLPAVQFAPTIDLGVLVLMVPLCALSLAIVFEVLRAAVTGLPRVQPPRLTAALSDWRPGHGEG